VLNNLLTFDRGFFANFEAFNGLTPGVTERSLASVSIR